MFNIQQAATKAGVSPGLLHLWVNIGKIKPSIDTTISPGTVDAIQDPIAKKALKQWTEHRDETAGWIFTNEDVKKIRRTAKRFKAWEGGTKEVDSYTTADLAQEWNLSADTIRKLFEAEKGVLKIGDSNPKHKRRYITLRIPKAVAERVHRRLSA
jgi:hypothetical protein